MYLDPRCFPSLFSPRFHDSHKGTFGAVGVIGGSRGMVGAALLAARAAVRIGAGRVYVDCLGAPDLRVDPLQPELMLRPETEFPSGLDAIVLGCGMAADATELHRGDKALVRALAGMSPLVLDAGALTRLADDPALARSIGARTAIQVITPHPGEAAQLLDCDVAAIQADRQSCARDLAQLCSTIVVLKGAGTVIAEPGGGCWINPTGNPALASAGTGDVLAGMIGGLLAQGYPALDAVRGAVWLHGRAAELHGDDRGLTASEVAPLAMRAWRSLRDTYSSDACGGDACGGDAYGGDAYDSEGSAGGRAAGTYFGSAAVPGIRSGRRTLAPKRSRNPRT